MWEELSETGTERGTTHPLKLALWSMNTGSYRAKRLAALADPKTPDWAIRWLLWKTSRALAKEGGGTEGTMSGESSFIFEAAAANPALSADLVEKVVKTTQRYLQHSNESCHNTTENLCRHPHLAKDRLDSLVVEGVLGAGIRPIRWPESEFNIQSLHQIRQGADEIRMIAGNPCLSEGQLGTLSKKWRQYHTEYQSARAMLKTSGGHGGLHQFSIDIQEQEAEAIMGCAAVLLSSHPQMGAMERGLIIAEMNRGAEPSGVWEHALRNVATVEEQNPRMYYVLFEARVAGLRGRQVVSTKEEQHAWEERLREMSCREQDPSDDRIIRAALERSPQTAYAVVTSSGLHERITWTPELVRHCLKSTLKEVRLFGLKGVAATKTHQTAIREAVCKESQARGETRNPQIDPKGPETGVLAYTRTRAPLGEGGDTNPETSRPQSRR